MTEEVQAGRLHLDAYVDTAGMTRGLQRRIDVEMRNIRARVRAEIDTRGMIADAKRAAVAAGEAARIRVQTRIDQAGLLRQVEAACAAASAAAVVRVRTQVDERSTSAAERRLDRMRRYNQVDVQVDADSAAAEAEIEGMRARQSRPIDIPVNVGAGLNTAGTALMQLAKAPAIAGGVFMLGTAVVQLGGGLIAMASAASTAVTTLAAIPNLVGIAGQAIGSLVIGFSGIGDAVGALATEQEQAATTATDLGRSQAASARQIASAQQAIGDARRAAAEATRAASERVSDAEWSLARAQEAALEAQEALNEARETARERIQDLNRELRASINDEEAAANALLTAREALQDVKWDTSASERERRDAENAVKQARDDLRAAQDNRKDLARETAEANREGVRGSEEVESARDALRDANHAAQESEEELANARRAAAQQQIDNARSIAAAQQALTDAQTGAVDAAVAQTAAQTDLANSMDNLSPAGQRFARFLFGLRGRWYDLRNAVQQSLLPPVQRGIEAALPLLDTLETGLVDTASRMGGFAERLGTLFGSETFNNDVGTIMASNNRALGSFSGAAFNLVQILRDLAVVAGPTLVEPFARWVETLTGGWRESINARRESGSLFDTFRRGARMASLLGDIVGNLAGALMGMGEAAVPSGRRLLRAFEDTTAGWDRFANSDAGQARMEEFFEATEPTTKALGDFTAQLLELITKLGEGGGGPLVAFLDTLTLIINGINRLLDIPGAGTALGWLFTLAGIGGALGMTAGFILKMARNVRRLAGIAGGTGKAVGLLGRGLTAVGHGAMWAARTIGGPLFRALLSGGRAMLGMLVTLGRMAATMLLATVRWIAHTAAIVAHRVAVIAVAAATKAWAIAQRLLNLMLLANPIGLVIAALIGFIALMVLLYKKNEAFRKLVNRVWAAVKTGIVVTWRRFIKPALQGLWEGLQTVGKWAVWLWDKAIRPSWRFIQAAIQTAWRNYYKPILKLLWEGLKTLGGWAKWLWEKAIRPAWRFISDAIRDGWRKVIKPAFDAMMEVLRDKIPAAFRWAKDKVQDIWDGLKKIASDPVEFVVNTVYNNGIRRVVNALPGVKDLPELRYRGFARGTSSVLPGYTPGKDVHRFWSPTAGGLALSGGEGIAVPQVVRALGSRAWNTLNEAGRRGVNAVRETLPSLVGGNPRRNRRFAKGGIIDDLGGLIGRVKNGVVGAAGGFGDRLRSWTATLGERFGPWGGMMGSVVKSAGSGLVGWMKDRLKSMFRASGSGGEATPNGLGGLGPAAIRAANYVRDAFGFTGTIGGYANRTIGSTGQLSKHALGKAIDVMVYGNKALGDRIANYFASPEGRTRFGVDNVIWYRQITNAGRGWNWGSYSIPGGSPHTDHPHIDFYDRGGPLYPGSTLAVNNSGKTETVFTNENVVDLSRHLAEVAHAVLSDDGGGGLPPLVGELTLVGRPEEMPSLLRDATYALRTIRRGGVHARRTA